VNRDAARRIGRIGGIGRISGISGALPVVVLTVGAWQRRWVSDDGFIVLRVVRMVTEGHGPVFNAGERAEAATSPLWVAVLAAADLAGPVRLEWLAVGLGILASAAGLAMASAGATRLWCAGADREPARITLPAGALVVAALPPAWDYATAGLETGLVLAWIGGCTWALATWARATDRRVPAAVAVLAGLGPLLRPDLLVVSVLLVGVLAWGADGPGWRDRARVVAVAVAAPLVVQVLRMGWYGTLAPTPVLAKEGTRAWWSQGWRWLTDGAGPYRLWIPAFVLAGLAMLLSARLRRREPGPARPVVRVVTVFPLAAAWWLAALVRAGGDFMHGRLLVPAVMLAAAPVAAVPVPPSRPGAGAGHRWVTLAAVGVLVAWAVPVAVAARPAPPEVGRAVNDVRAFSVALTGRTHPVTLADWGAAPGGPRAFRTRPGVALYDGQRPVRVAGRPLRARPALRPPVIVAYGVGLVAYAAGPEVRVFDALGLGDALTARFALAGRGRRPGHEKVSPPAWTWGRLVAPGEALDPGAFPLPELLVADRAPTVASPRLRRLTPAGVRSVRRALRCGRVARLADAVEAPMHPGRFLRNVGFAVTSATWRVPADPLRAARVECRRRGESRVHHPR